MNKNGDPFASVKVIHRLEVGPIKVERKRLTVPYRVFQNDHVYMNELIYKYEEEVFDPGEMDSLNLASMIAAQVAVNYGLFCDVIVFHGIYDDLDRCFLHNMIENTAREIYVKKFLEYNQFLIREAVKLPVIKKEHYSQAKLVFVDMLSGASKYEKKRWKTDASCYAILSSGGKDSLLSFGLIHELGYTVHAIFGNESGRHWFTALNAYRYLKANHSNTTRVWMNSDRIFAWMLRRLPFVRQDFANIRSDEYPIRLWTVAVFLFGILPLIRKRNAGRILIGDEYDSTWCTSYKGIQHYNGLYDQSIFFDGVMTSYFMNKGWGVSQFSVLRQLSEMLIEKILVERYPDLQRHQISCHATHIKGDRVFPCGRCEKCRRIVGMLMAIGADPAHCGYSNPQIERCLKDVTTKSVHQDSESAQHLIWLLSQNNLIQLSEKTKALTKPHPEIFKLRFHQLQSPPECIPEDLRGPLYHLLLQHAEGSIRYADQNWITFYPLSDPAL